MSNTSTASPHRLCLGYFLATLLFLLGGIQLRAVAPVAVADSYIVDQNGLLCVRSSYATTLSAFDPSLYWRFNDANSNSAVTAADRGADGISSAAAPTTLPYLSSAPALRASGNFSGFQNSNYWFGFGDEGGGGYVGSLINPTSGWGSDLGAISFWFKTNHAGGDSQGVSTTAQAPHAFFSGISAKNANNKPASYYSTAVFVGLLDGKVIFRVSENDVPIVELLTKNTYHDSQWHHVLVTWDNAGNVSTLYLDGGLKAGAAKSETVKSFSFDLASDFDFSGYGVSVGKGAYSGTAYDGFMDEFAIWEHKTLNAQAARDLYYSGVGGLLSNDTDADQDSLTATKLSDPSQGSITFESTGSFTYQAPAAASTQTFTYKVNDGNSDSNVITATITVNAAPSGNDDTAFVIAPGSTLQVPAASGVLANDSDPDGDSLYAFIAASPAQGALTLETNGSFSYDTTGVSDGTTVTFSYRASDGSLDAASNNTVTILVTSNQDPVISQGSGPLVVTMSEDGSPTPWSTPSLDASDPDSDDNALVWSLSSAASNGTATVSGTGVSPSTFTYVPNANFNGSDSFAVQVSDGVKTDTMTVNVTVESVDDPPVAANPSSDVSVVEDAANVTIDLSTVFDDLDSDNAAITKTVTSSNPSLVSATLSGNSLTLGFQPDQSGSSTITVTATSNGLTVADSFAVTVTPVNDVPVLISGGGLSVSTNVAEGQSVAYDANASDADGDALTHSLSGGADVSRFAIDPSTGAITFNTTPDFEIPADANLDNAYEVVVAVSDGVASATQSITVNVTDSSADGVALTQGLLAFYPFDGNANDASGNGHHGTATGTALAADRMGVVAKAYDFDGVNDFISVPVGSTINTANTDFSISLWVYPRANNGHMVEQESDPNLGRSVLHIHSSGAIYTNVSGSGLQVGSLPLNLWHHLILNYDISGGSATVTIYHNALVAGTATVTTLETSNRNYLFGKSVASGGFLNGVMDEVRIYQRPLTTTEITALHNKEKPNFPPTDIHLSNASLSENSAIGSFIGEFNATDAEIGSTHTFTLVEGNGSEHNNLFTLETNGTLKTGASLDFEANASRSIRVRVTDESLGVFEKIFAIHLTNVNEAPAFAGGTSSFSLSENTASSFLINATDPDAGANLTYSISGTDASLFNLNSATGELTFRQPPDYEGAADSGADNSHQVTITVSDGAASITQAVTVLVTDANDLPTDIHLSNASILEGQPIGSLVGQFTATDPDDPNGSAVYSYALVAGEGADWNSEYTLEQNGTLRTAVQYDFEGENSDGNPTLGIRVQVTDGQNASFSKAFVITVLDDNTEDADQDGIAEADEEALGTSDLNSDSDGDGFSDASEVLVGADPARADSYPNSPPTLISLAPATILENQPADTIVGVLSTQDIDQNDTHQYALVDAAGTPDNASFRIEGNALRATGILDYETKSSYDLLISSTDTNGSTLRQSLIVQVIDAFRPGVETLSPTKLKTSSVRLRGRIHDHGGLPLLQQGFVLGRSPDPVAGQSGALYFSVATANGNSFAHKVEGLKPGLKYFARAYAENAEGFTYGEQVNFTTTTTLGDGPFGQTTEVAGAANWQQSDWLGSFYRANENWIYHAELGWLYVTGENPQSAWIWSQRFGWFWTGRGVYPYLYRQQNSDWYLFLQNVPGHNIFYRFGTHQWINWTGVSGQ